jgi:hypothetical protein
LPFSWRPGGLAVQILKSFFTAEIAENAEQINSFVCLSSSRSSRLRGGNAFIHHEGAKDAK